MSVNVKKRLGLKIRQRFLGSSLAKSGGKEAFGLRVVGAGNEEDSHCTLQVEGNAQHLHYLDYRERPEAN